MNHIPPYTRGGQQKILGFPMNQNRYAVPSWSYLMEIYPPARVIEIGSNNGGFALALGLNCWNIGAQMISWDTMQAPSEQWNDLAKFLKVQFIRGDVFDPVNLKSIHREISKPGVTYLLCDGGNKPKEFNEFACSMKSGDVIAAHDFCQDDKYWVCEEMRLEYVQSTILRFGLRHFNQLIFDQAAWVCFRKE